MQDRHGHDGGRELPRDPRYWATGVSEEDFTDEQGNPISVWKAVTGRIAAVEGENAKLVRSRPRPEQLPPRPRALARIVSSLYGLPPHYLGYSTENPASAEGIKSSEARLEKRAERKQRSLRTAGKRSYASRADPDGKWDKDLERLETIWRDPSTPDGGPEADAALKLYTTPGGPIVPLRQTREGSATPRLRSTSWRRDEKLARRTRR